MPYREAPSTPSDGEHIVSAQDMDMDIVGHRRGHVNVYLFASGSLAVLSPYRL